MLPFTSQFATLKRGEHPKYTSLLFTEHGILMLSNVIKSEKAIAVSIQIIDVFVKIRKLVFDNVELRMIVEEIGKQSNNDTKNIELVFQYLDELMEKNKRK